MQVEDENGMIKDAGGDVTLNPKGPVELEVDAIRDKSDEEKLQFLLKRALIDEKQEQRDDDIGRDHGIRLFSRQKKQSACKIVGTLISLMLVYGIQLVALYNLTRQASFIDSTTLMKWLERGIWAPTNPGAVDLNDTFNLDSQVRVAVDGSEIDIFRLAGQGFCLTGAGAVDVFFNVGIGLVMIYLFLFFDLWFVVFDMPLVKNRPGEPHGLLMLFGEFILVIMNTAIVVWLGIVSGFSVIANSGDFYSVLFASLQLFIVIVIDDTVLPAIRFFVEEAGRLDEFGNLRDQDLDLLTHGAQYYKPGYGHAFVRNWEKGGILGFISVVTFLFMLTIIVAPAVATIVFAVNTFQRC